MLKPTALLALAGLLSSVSAQQVGTKTAEVHPALTWYKCSTAGRCVPQAGKVVLDANWRWLQSTSDSTNCYTSNTWNCPDTATCTANCALDGADYSGTYGVSTDGTALTLQFVRSNGNSKNVGSRLYLMSDDSTYNIFKLLNQEFSFDVDVSQLPCGLNGALYFVEMEADGGLSKHPTNKAGAKYGTGYCDSRCPRELKFIDGEANNHGWTGTSENGGTGKYGSCCNEMDIWEANSISAAYTPHPCSVTGPYRCEGDKCSNVCDPDGCDFNSYRLGNKAFYGPGKRVDTAKKFTVVTQFVTDDGTATGNLSEIRRLYVQEGVVIQNSVNKITGIPAVNSITQRYCDTQKDIFHNPRSFQEHGGLAGIGTFLGRGGVLVFSVWDDYTAKMLWLDSTYPANCTGDGCSRGTCPIKSGAPSEVEVSAASASVVYSNIRFGDIDSTYPSTKSRARRLPNRAVQDGKNDTKTP